MVARLEMVAPGQLEFFHLSAGQSQRLRHRVSLRDQMREIALSKRNQERSSVVNPIDGTGDCLCRTWSQEPGPHAESRSFAKVICSRNRQTALDWVSRH